MPGGENCLSGNINRDAVTDPPTPPDWGSAAWSISHPVYPIVSFFIVLVLWNVALVPF
jgi:hypothetical protein